MKWKTILFLPVLALLTLSCSKALFIDSKGPESAADAQVIISKYGSTENSGYYHYTIKNTGETDLSMVSFDITCVVDLTPNNPADKKVDSYRETIIHTGKIIKGGHFSGKENIQLNPINSKILSQESITYTNKEKKRTINKNGITRQYTAYATDLNLTITNASNLDINEMRVDVLVKSKTIHYYISGVHLRAENLADASVIHSYTITNVPKNSTITKTYKNIHIELDTLTEQEKKTHTVYPVFDVKVIHKSILNPGTLYEKLQRVSVSDKVTAE